MEHGDEKVLQQVFLKVDLDVPEGGMGGKFRAGRSGEVLGLHLVCNIRDSSTLAEFLFSFFWREKEGGMTKLTSDILVVSTAMMETLPLHRSVVWTFSPESNEVPWTSGK